MPEKRLVPGFVAGAAVVVAMVGLSKLGVTVLSPPPGLVETSAEQPGLPIRIEEVKGDVSFLARTGAWLRPQAGDLLREVAGFRAASLDSSIRLSWGSLRLTAAHRAELVLGPTARYLELASGFAEIHREGTVVELFVPVHGLQIVGSDFGVWVGPDRVVLSVLDEAALVSVKGDQHRFLKGQEASLEGGNLVAAPAPARLELTVQGTNPAGSYTQLRGTASPNIVLWAVRGPEKFEEVRVTPAGTFSTWIPAYPPAPGMLFAFDASGRSWDAATGGSGEPQAPGAPEPAPPAEKSD